jgi:hypothetical protein
VNPELASNCSRNVHAMGTFSHLTIHSPRHYHSLNGNGMNPDQSIKERGKEALDEEVLASMRAFAELIFDVWKEQHSTSIPIPKPLNPSRKNSPAETLR